MATSSTATFNISNVYFVSLKILPNPELNMQKSVESINTYLTENITTTELIMKCKVSDKSRIILVVQVNDAVRLEALERTLAGIDEFCGVVMYFYPVVDLDQVLDYLPGLNTNLQQKKGLFLLEFVVGELVIGFDTFCTIWRKEARAVVEAWNMRATQASDIDIYRVVDQRKLYVFLHGPDPDLVNVLTEQLPILIENAANVHVNCRPLVLLDEAVAIQPVENQEL